MRRRLAVVAPLSLLLLLPATPAVAQGDNTAIAINTKDGFDLFRLAFQVRRVTQDVVDTSNIAFAYASCTDCQTVAIAIQIVLISGTDSSVVAPENLAIAINESCVLCDTLASAYQFVLTADGALRFTPEGRRRLAEIRKALLDLRKSDLTGAQIQARLDTLMDDLAHVLSTELVPAGKPDTAPSGSPGGPSGTPVTASPTPADAASGAPSDEPPTTGTSATVDPTADPTGEPTATATP